MEAEKRPQTQREFMLSFVLQMMINSPPNRMGLYILRKRHEAYAKYPQLTLVQQYRAIRKGVKRVSK